MTLCLLLLLPMMTVPASAGGIIGNLEIEISAMNELTARQKVNQYFEQRLAYLNGTAVTIEVVNAGMLEDEAKHKAFLLEKGITMVTSSVVIDYTICREFEAVVAVTETASFLINGAVQQESVSHEISMCTDEDGVTILQRDVYFEGSTGFESCSYISPAMLAAAQAEVAGTGSGLCITRIAYNEVNAADSSESSTGKTKYGEWYEVYKPAPGAANQDWCAMFVSWCAYHANVPATIVMCDWGVGHHRTFFVEKNKYYTNFEPGTSGAYTPSVGDLVFISGTAESPQHIGIVYSVGSELIWIVDGNKSFVAGERDHVCFRSLRLTDSSVVAFGKPSYGSPGHTKSTEWTYSSTKHWKVCTNCSYGSYESASHTASGWRWDGTKHWKVCTVCGYSQISKGSHTTTWDDELQAHVCTACGFESLVPQP